MGKEKGKEQGKANFFIDFALGGVAAVISKTLVAPIERVKLLLQTQAVIKGVGEAGGKKYTGTLNCFATVCKEEGFASLWRGNMTNIIRYFPT